MGTNKQKLIQASGLLGIPVQSLKYMMSRSATSVPCIYRLSLGSCKDLRESMNISTKIPDEYTVIKYGCTDNFTVRTCEHMATYGTIEGANVELLNFAYIDPKFSTDAETDIKKFFADIEMHLDHRKFEGLVIINPKYEKHIFNQFKYITNEFAGNTKEMATLLEKAAQEKENLKQLIEKEKERLEFTMEKIRHDLSMEKEHLKRLIEILKEKYQVELLKKDIEIEKIKGTFMNVVCQN
jgi:hypothetical protein